MDKIVVNGMDMKVFQDKDADAQRWHLYNRMNDILLLIHRHISAEIDTKNKFIKRFKRIERVGIYSGAALVLIVGVLFGLGILKWELIKPFIS